MVLPEIRVVAKTGGNIVGEALRGQGTFYEWNHYPKGDVYDSETHPQYYYHAHAAGQRKGDGCGKSRKLSFDHRPAP